MEVLSIKVPVSIVLEVLTIISTEVKEDPILEVPDGEQPKFEKGSSTKVFKVFLLVIEKAQAIVESSHGKNEDVQKEDEFDVKCDVSVCNDIFSKDFSLGPLQTSPHMLPHSISPINSFYIVKVSSIDLDI